MPEEHPVEVTPEVLRAWPLPAPGGDKEERGSVLVIGGSVQVPGAVRLTAEAALRVGAGKVQVVTVRSAVMPFAITVPEALVLGLDETGEGGIAASALGEVEDLAAAAAVVVVGPGMVDEAATIDLLDRLLPALRGPVVLDALGLAAITDDHTRLHHLDARAVLTPNLRELAIMLGADDEEIESDPAGAAVELARRTRVVVAAGGAVSWTAAPDGRLWRDGSGSSGLGVAGSGDVLAGTLAGLCARTDDPSQAAVWAGHLHGAAGDLLADEIGPVGFLARELPAQLPRVLAWLDR